MFTKAKRPIGLIVALAILAIAAITAPLATNIPKENAATVLAISPPWTGKTISAHDAANEVRLQAEAEAAALAAQKAAEAEKQRLAQVAAAKARASRQKAVRSPVQAFSGDLSALVDRLAMCESGMRADAVSRNGKFFGAFQFMLSTWRKFRPGNPTSYSYAEQKAVIMQFFPVSSWRSQFPTCSRKLGVA